MYLSLFVFILIPKIVHKIKKLATLRCVYRKGKINSLQFLENSLLHDVFWVLINSLCRLSNSSLGF